MANYQRTPSAGECSEYPTAEESGMAGGECLTWIRVGKLSVSFWDGFLFAVRALVNVPLSTDGWWDVFWSQKYV